MYLTPGPVSPVIWALDLYNMEKLLVSSTQDGQRACPMPLTRLGPLDIPALTCWFHSARSIWAC